MKVSADFVCEHGMPQPWATCTDCMLLPRDRQPEPPAPEPAKVKAKPKPAGRRKASTGSRATGRAPTPRPSTRLPRSPTDLVPDLFGQYALAYEIPEQNLRYHTQGSDSDWLPIASMPRDLRHSGWVYLQIDRKLVARCRVRTIGFRDRRWTHEKPGDTRDAGPGGTLELFDDGWEFISIDLGPAGDRSEAGYRYLVTGPDGEVSLALAEDR
ncbi:MAG: hypothetical protein HKN24_06415 [Acidimicrobiales bacterium]|nr:hypothetical protein [Acidimicrobiales bacterium]